MSEEAQTSSTDSSEPVSDASLKERSKESPEEAYERSCRRVAAARDELDSAMKENGEVEKVYREKHRQMTLAECNALSSQANAAEMKDRIAATNYAASRGLVVAPQKVSSPAPRLPKAEGK